MTRYRIMISRELLEQEPGLDWPEGVRLAEVTGPALAGFRFATIEDDNAAEALEGCLVDLTLQRNAITGEVTVFERTAVGE